MNSIGQALASKILSPKTLVERLQALRAHKKSIATLNGSFDILHAGHLEMIYQASKQADILVMCLNTDQSIKTYKSPLRPIIPLESRLQMVGALQFVDFVTWFDETDPCDILEQIRPDVHVNGAEYGENCIEASTVIKHGGRIHIVPLIPGLSTSVIIQKIKNL